MRSSPPLARPLFLQIAPDAVFGTFHAPADDASSTTAVLIVPPWGWDEITSYASRRAWAERLAADGHPTLRIDLPATGDSAGSPTDPSRMEAWSGAVIGAAAWLAARPGVTRVAAIGLGLGGLIAGKALADGAPIDDLVLWSAPPRGRAYLREQRAFVALQSSRYSLAGDPEPAILPDDWLEVGGFVLTAETMEAIGGLELDRMPIGQLRRALLLEREGMGRFPALEAHLTECGVAVTVAPGRGWTDMVFHPERYVPPTDVFDRVADWLGQAPSASAGSTSIEPPLAEDRLELRLDGMRVRESPVTIQQPFGQLFGLLAEPPDAPRTSLCAIFLNAGAVRRVGPNRLWVETARRWSAMGVPTIRMDLEGIGDAGGDPRRYVDVGNFYTPAFGAAVGAILDDLEARGFGPRFVLIGLCAGAYWAFTTAATDRRVVEALVLNPRAMVWDPGLLSRREARKVARVLEPALWNRVVRGDVSPSRIIAVSRAIAARMVEASGRGLRRVFVRRRTDTTGEVLENRLDAIRDLGTRLVIAFSGDEPVYDELESDGILAGMQRWPNVAIETLPGRDHTVRPIVAQRAVHDLFERELDRLVGHA